MAGYGSSAWKPTSSHLKMSCLSHTSGILSGSSLAGHDQSLTFCGPAPARLKSLKKLRAADPAAIFGQNFRSVARTGHVRYSPGRMGREAAPHGIWLVEPM